MILPVVMAPVPLMFKIPPRLIAPWIEPLSLTVEPLAIETALLALVEPVLATVSVPAVSVVAPV